MPIERLPGPPREIPLLQGAETLYEVDLTADPSPAWRAAFLWPPLDRLTSEYTPACPITLSPGTATDLILGYFPMLIIGMRTELQIEASRVAADTTDSAFRNLQVWIRAYLRGDVLVARETWFAALTGVTN